MKAAIMVFQYVSTYDSHFGGVPTASGSYAARTTVKAAKLKPNVLAQIHKGVTFLRVAEGAFIKIIQAYEISNPNNDRVQKARCALLHNFGKMLLRIAGALENEESRASAIRKDFLDEDREKVIEGIKSTMLSDAETKYRAALVEAKEFGHPKPELPDALYPKKSEKEKPKKDNKENDIKAVGDEEEARLGNIDAAKTWSTIGKEQTKLTIENLLKRLGLKENFQKPIVNLSSLTFAGNSSSAAGQDLAAGQGRKRSRKATLLELEDVTADGHIFAKIIYCKKKYTVNSDILYKYTAQVGAMANYNLFGGRI